MTAGRRRFRRDFARARTFGFMRDVAKLWSAGYALGASLENTLVVSDSRILNPEGTRFPDEFVRHKVLDAIGDLALAGAPLLGAVPVGARRPQAQPCRAVGADGRHQRLDAGRGRAGASGARPCRSGGRAGGAGLRAGRVLNPGFTPGFRVSFATFRADCPHIRLVEPWVIGYSLTLEAPVGNGRGFLFNCFRVRMLLTSDNTDRRVNWIARAARALALLAPVLVGCDTLTSLWRPQGRAVR